jgi:hypothetical protein
VNSVEVARPAAGVGLKASGDVRKAKVSPQRAQTIRCPTLVLGGTFAGALQWGQVNSADVMTSSAFTRADARERVDLFIVDLVTPSVQASFFFGFRQYGNMQGYCGR